MRQILIIDDEDDIREVAALSLEATAGWEIITACSGAAGIRAAANPKSRPHAILMDVMMPGMDGPTTFRQMQQNPDTAGIPVLLLTAKVQGVDQRRFAGPGGCRGAVQAIRSVDAGRADFCGFGLERLSAQVFAVAYGLNCARIAPSVRLNHERRAG